jgi:hypothetical protein
VSVESNGGGCIDTATRPMWRYGDVATRRYVDTSTRTRLRLGLRFRIAAKIDIKDGTTETIRLAIELAIHSIIVSQNSLNHSKVAN